MEALHEHAAPVRAPFFNRVTWFWIALAAIGVIAGIYRFGAGLRASTNLDHFYPWGLWIIADVSFIALAAGGFITTALVHVLHRERYHFLARPALLTALLGYTFAFFLLAADLGRYWAVWHPILPSMWQGNSALFEVGLCVMAYLTVLYIEFVPIFCERFAKDGARPRFAALCRGVLRIMDRLLPAFLVLGVAISCLHQSSLGHIFVLAPTKLHPLWWTPVLALLFLLSAAVVGLPTVIFVYLCTAKLTREPVRIAELARLARLVALSLSLYFAAKLADMVIRRSYGHLLEPTVETAAFLIEVGFGVLLPLLILLPTRWRHSPRALGTACLLVMLGVALNRANVYWIGYRPLGAARVYTPSLAEWGFTIGILALLVLAWRFVAINFPILTPSKRRTA